MGFVEREEVNGAFRLAATMTLGSIRQDRARFPEHETLFEHIEKHLFTRGFGVKAARRLSGIGGFNPPLGKPLAAYLEEHRIQTCICMLKIADGRIPTGRAAAAVGIASYDTYRRAFKRYTGEYPTAVRFRARLSPEFDNLAWHYACQGALSSDTWSLGRRLRLLYPLAFADGPPRAELLPDGGAWPARVRRSHGIAEAEARKAVEHAAEKPIRRLRSDAKALPRDLAAIFQDVAENLFSDDLGVGRSLQRVGVRDTSISTKACFFVGDPLNDYIEKRRIETTVQLLGDPRFTIERISEAMGLSCRRLRRMFKKRAGANPSEVIKTLKKTRGHPAYKLWCRAESRKLSIAEARVLGGHLRALCPEALKGLERPILTLRSDIEPRRVELVVKLSSAIEPKCKATLNAVFRTHPRYSAAHWYIHWIRDRLGRAGLESAWAEWQMANRDLRKLLQFPSERRQKLIYKDRAYQTDVFLWLLVDCVTVRLFHDVAESEHFADLALTAAEARWRRDRRAKTAGLLALALALKGNALKRRNELTEASEKFEKALWAIRSFALEPWIMARVHSLYSKLLYRKGEELKARRALFLASANFKRARDELERLRCAIDRSAAWFYMGKDPSRLLTICIASLDRFPFASNLRHTAHVARIVATIYLTDRLASRNLPTIKNFRIAMPPATSAYASAEYQQVDGLIAALEGKPDLAVSQLKGAADWFASHDLLGDAAVCWLQYSWAAVALDSSAASQAAMTAYAYMERTGFKSQGLQKVALKIYRDAQQCG